MIVVHNTVGMTGEVRLDDGGDRIGNYRVWHLRVNDDLYEPLLDVLDTVERDHSHSVRTQHTALHSSVHTSNLPNL